MALYVSWCSSVESAGFVVVVLSASEEGNEVKLRIKPAAFSSFRNNGVGWVRNNQMW